MSQTALAPQLSPWRARISLLMPGLAVSCTVCLAAFAVAQRYDAPVMLFALLFGIALSFLTEDARIRAGSDSAATTGLKLGVALMGASVSFEVLSSIGLRNAVLTLSLSVATLGLGLGIGRAVGWSPARSLVAAGSVAICGASAALALASVTAGFRNKQDHVLIVIVTATSLSTGAMVLYPVILTHLGLSDHEVGIVLGASIHDVAQVIGAGFSVSDEAGETAVLTKMLRVAFLPVVVLLSSSTMGRGGARRRRFPVPWFVVVFVLVMALNQVVALPEALTEGLENLSRVLLVVAVTALGLTSSPKKILEASGITLGVIVTLTLILGLAATTGVILLK